MTSFPVSQPVPRTVTGNNGRLLVVDDDAQVLQGLARTLSRHGYECVTAAGPGEAVELLRDGTIETVISDIHMPGNAQLQFVERIAELRPGLPVVLLTGLPNVDTAIKGVRLAVAGYIVKPPNMGELLELLGRSVARTRKLRAVRTSRERVEAWAEELRRVEDDLEQRPNAADQTSDFLRLTLHNIAVQLSSLARPFELADGLRSASAQIDQVEMLSALQQTVATLERTRKSFKSKELGELRRQLEMLLGGRQGRGGTMASAGETFPKESAQD
jgi:ActR/RegA family two-component response regulator